MHDNVNSLRYSSVIAEWYAKNKRDLPWRNTKDAYCIWISEIILQQTRVVQGYDYYLRFIARFPNVASLALAEQAEVLKYWQGLGYYSRARNLHEASKQILSRFQGVFPHKYEDILSLKGIGEYTAAAIVSFVWNQPYPVIDGNVFRVLSRLFSIEVPVDTGVGKKLFRELAYSLMNPKCAGLHNQAIMEFGALQCVPKNPACTQCPLADYCLGYASGHVMKFPVKQNKTKTRNRYFNYFHIMCSENTYLQRRSEKDIWEGLFEFPLIETDQAIDFEALQVTEEFGELFNKVDQPVFSVAKSGVKHVLSHQILYVTFYKVVIQAENGSLKKYVKTPIASVDHYPVSQLTHHYLNSLLISG